MGEILKAGGNFIEVGRQGQQNVTGTGVDEFASALAPIGSILVAVGIIIFLAVLGIMAIKMITAKPDQKAKLKQQFIGYVVAAVVFFGAIGIWTTVRTIMNNIEGSIPG